MTDAVLETTPAANSQDGGVATLITTYRRHLWLILLVAAVIFAFAAGATFLMVPKYTADATVVLAPQRVQFGADTTVQQSDPTGSFGVDTRVEQLKSRELTEAVVRRLNLMNDEEFFKPHKGEAQAPDHATKDFDTVVDKVSRSFKPKRVGQTMLLDLRFTSKDPHKAALIDKDRKSVV